MQQAADPELLMPAHDLPYLLQMGWLGPSAAGLQPEDCLALLLHAEQICHLCSPPTLVPLLNVSLKSGLLSDCDHKELADAQRDCSLAGVWSCQ